LSKKNNGFIEGAVAGFASLLRETLENELIAARPGFLQRSDPRMKCLGIALLIATAMLAHSLTPLAVLYLLCLSLAVGSRISLVFFLKRTLPFIPLFSLFIAAPAIFSGVTPGTIVAGFSFFGSRLAITRQGIDAASLLLLRVTVSVSLAALLILTTRHHILLKTLRIFRVPQLFVMTMGMSYRYILLLIDIVQNTFLGIKSRVGFVASSRAGRRIAAVNMASLWLRSYRLHSQVYDAMLSRGYTGEPVVRQEFRARAADYLLVAAACGAMIGTLWCNRFLH
jgi:cobalt/nickel transport system permease protein